MYYEHSTLTDPSTSCVQPFAKYYYFAPSAEFKGDIQQQPHGVWRQTTLDPALIHNEPIVYRDVAYGLRSLDKNIM